MKKRLSKIQEIVFVLLKHNELLRNSDDALYYRVCVEFNEMCTGLTFKEFFQFREQLGCPTFESVSRCRRKIQEEYPELRAMDEILNIRAENEKVYRQFSKEVVNG